MVGKPWFSAFQNFFRIENPLNIKKVMGRNMESSLFCTQCIDCLARMSKQSIHCVQNKLDSMFLPITFLIFNGFSIRKKFWNAENQGFPTIPPNPIYVEAVEACRSSRYIVYKINYIQWYARRSSRYIVCKIKTTFNSMHVEAVDTLCTK